MSRGFAIVAALALLASSARSAMPPPDPDAVARVMAHQSAAANAAWWGFDPVNATAALQAAINSGARRVIVPNVGQDWIVDPIMLASNQEIVLERGVVITARKGGYPGQNDSLFRAERKRNITIRGYGATLRMQKPEYTTGEWRMCLALGSCTNVRVLGLTLRDSGGDGIYVGATDPQQPYCRDIVVRDCVMDNHRRQGISVISAVNLRVERCTFRNTAGTRPSAGVDLEPNEPTEKLTNCVFRDCRIEGNDGPGILVNTDRLDAATDPISVRFERCRVSGGRGAGLNIGGTREPGPRGMVEFADCVVRGCQGPGAEFFRKSAGAFRVRFTRCEWRSVARRPDAVPIWFRQWTRLPVGTLGGVEFVDSVLVDDRDRPFVSVHPDTPPTAIADLSGTLTVRNPHGARMSLGLAAREITLQVR